MENKEASAKSSLRRLVLLSVSAILLAMLLGNLISNALITRDYLAQQLHAHARDAATSLGLSLSVATDASDAVLAGRMIDAIYDSGNFTRIVYSNHSGELIHQTSGEEPAPKVPSWLLSVFELKVPVATAQVMSGWSQLGELYVQSSTRMAYEEMWQTMTSQFYWFLVVLVLSLGLVYLLLRRLLKPLAQVEHQALQMEQRKFSYRLPEPSTRELSAVAGAMNKMAASLGDMFARQLDTIEDLRASTQLDGVTALYNREGFDLRLDADLSSEHGSGQGVLLLLQIQHFARFNQNLGRNQADEILQSVAQVLEVVTVGYEASYAARRTGADFCVFLPDVAAVSVGPLVEQILSHLSGLQWARESLQEDLFFIGVAEASPGDKGGDVLTKADTALRQAQVKRVSGWQVYQVASADEVDAGVRAASHWHDSLQQALREQRFRLYTQDIVPFDEARHADSGFKQVLARLELDDELLSAQAFLPMAKRFGLMPALDRLVISEVLQRMPSLKGRFGVSLSEQAMLDNAFVDWLMSLQVEHASSLARLNIHVSEHLLRHGEQAFNRLAQYLEQVGAALVIERFGTSSLAFSYLQRYKIAAIKIDHSFIRGVESHAEHQFFLRSVIQLAHSQGVQVISVGVETAAEYAWLQAAGVDALMGFYLDKPVALLD